MDKIPVVIIEDEIRNQKLLDHMIKKHCADLTIVGIAQGVQEAIDLIQETKPEIIFLDIQLKDGNGFEILNQIPVEQRPNTIFTTAFDQYALEAFKYSAVNYLLKPINKEELIFSVGKAVSLKKKDEIASVNLLLDKIMDAQTEPMISISDLKSTEYIKISEIIHIVAMGSYSKIILKNGKKHTVSKVIKIYDEMLAGHGFFRSHQSHLINLKSVQSYHRGDQVVILENDDEVSIARNRKEDFLKAMDQMVL